MKKTDYILRIGQNYVYHYEELADSSSLPWTLPLVSNAMQAYRYKNLSEAKRIQQIIGGEIYRVTTTVEKLEEEK